MRRAVCSTYQRLSSARLGGVPVSESEDLDISSNLHLDGLKNANCLLTTVGVFARAVLKMNYPGVYYREILFGNSDDD